MKQYLLASMLLISAAYALPVTPDVSPGKPEVIDNDAVPNGVPTFNGKNAMVITTFNSKGCDKPMKQASEHAIADGHAMNQQYPLTPKQSVQFSNMKDCSVQVLGDKNLDPSVQATARTYTQQDAVNGKLCLTREQLLGSGSYVVSCPGQGAQAGGGQGGNNGQGAGDGSGGDTRKKAGPGTGIEGAVERLGVGNPKGGPKSGRI